MIGVRVLLAPTTPGAPRREVRGHTRVSPLLRAWHGHEKTRPTPRAAQQAQPHENSHGTEQNHRTEHEATPHCSQNKRNQTHKRPYYLNKK